MWYNVFAIAFAAQFALWLYLLVKCYFRCHSKQYDGELVLVQDRGGVKTYSLELDGDPELLVEKEDIHFKVRTTGIPVPPAA